VKTKDLIKYFVRFVILQILITTVTIWYFDKFLIGNYFDGFLKIKDNLLEDRDRFYPFIPNDFIKIDIYLAIFVFIFLIILYFSKFYSYINDLSFTITKSIFDEFLPIYLIWTSSFLSFLQLLRFDEVSRFHTLILTLIIPIILVSFRNSEFISLVLGRNPSKESYITFNLKNDSVFRELRIMALRKNLKNFQLPTSDFNLIKKTIENFNKKNEINILVFDFSNLKSLSQDFIDYLLKLNKKIIIIGEPSLLFTSNFLHRTEIISNKAVHYINNDIQFGSKFILKRIIDLSFLIVFSIIFIPISIATYFFITFTNGKPGLIKQTRVGLHGKNFEMYKFRTMVKESHLQRDTLKNLNTHSGPLFKIKDDPRIIKGGKFLRKYSFDEIPQLINVIKGEMSFVGPRPLFPEDNNYFDDKYIRRLNVLPGITGLLQINERNTDDFNTWYKYDIEYIENWTLGLDIKIIFKTPIAILKSKIKGI
jgi:lipopolysaccharide/colanic/teichoic acid biosynthesis glycosyltransferase